MYNRAMRAALCVVAAAVFVASVAAEERLTQQRAVRDAQPVADRPPVHATLRLAEGRSSFKSGEPIRLQLVLTADRPGFVADTLGADDPSDVLSISPEDGVRRFPRRGGRDYFSSQRLSRTPTVIDLAANYWARFDGAGTYTVAIQTRRVSPVGADGWRVSGQSLPLKTNAVTFRIEPTSVEDEQALIGRAVRNLQSSLTQGLSEQIRAAEELAFLPGDAAAIEKYRWFRELGANTKIPGNARGLLIRGFLMSRNPAVILTQVETDLLDLSRAVTADTILNAVSLAVAINHPNAPESASPWLPRSNSSDPYSLERARYVKLVHDSLESRTGLVKLRSAGAILDVLARNTPADVVRLIVDGFEQFPVETRTWFASGRWDVIRDKQLGPALRRTLDEVDPWSRTLIFPALIDLAPDLALEPLVQDILDPTRIISTEIVAKMPRGSLSHVAPQLLVTIEKMLNASDRELFRAEWKIEVLAVVADGAVHRDVRVLFDTYAAKLGSNARNSLLRYLAQWRLDR